MTQLDALEAEVDRLREILGFLEGREPHSPRVGLTPSERRVMAVLLRAKAGVPVPRRVLHNATITDDVEPSEEPVIKVFIGHIRDKLGPLGYPRSVIRNDRGIGYYLDPQHRDALRAEFGL